jgi:hypothetical protein
MEILAIAFFIIAVLGLVAATAMYKHVVFGGGKNGRS